MVAARHRVAVCLLILLGQAGPVLAADWPSVTIEPADGKPIDQPTPVTFGMAFKPGELGSSFSISAQLDGENLPVQVDVKRQWPDGSSTRHAVVSLLLPRLAKPARLVLSTGSESPPPGLSRPGGRGIDLAQLDLKLTAEFTFPDGKKCSADLAKALAATTRPDYWLAGQTVTEQTVNTRPTDAEGRPDPDLLVQFHVRYYAGTKSTRVAVVVEKDLDTGSDGGIAYDLVIRSGDKVLAEARNVRQPDYTRCRHVVWLGDQPRAVRVKYDARAWSAAGLVPNYDFAAKSGESALARAAEDWSKSGRGLFEAGIICPYFGATGGRPDIGVLPRWTAQYLLTMDQRAEQVMLDCAERAAYVPMHMRRQATGRVPSHETDPDLWFDYRAKGKNKFRQSAGPARAEVKQTFSPDIAHQPELAYVPYLVTGDRYFLDELYAWASYTILNNGYRGKAGEVTTGQLRACAWGLRTVGVAAMLAPDGDPERGEFTRRIAASIRNYMESLNGPDAWPLKTLRPGLNQDGFTMAPWQHDYLICAADFLARAGFKEAEPFRAELLEFSMGRFSHAADFNPKDGLGYWWIVGAQDKQTKAVTKIKTWKELHERNYPAGAKTSWADYPGGYGDLALAAAAIAVRTGYPSGRQVYDYLHENLPGVVKQRADAPEWALGPEAVK